MSGFSSLNAFSDSDYSGYLLATVKFNNDPERKQRVKVHIPKLMEGSEDNLPWISPIVQSPFGLTSNAGVVEVPALGALVVVRFQEGNIYYGLCHGSVPTASYTPNAALLLNYPNRRGWSDPLGNLFWIDNTSGQNQVHFQHASGTFINIDNTGKIQITSVNEIRVDCVTAKVNASTSTEVTSPTNTINGNVILNGNLTQTGNVSLTGNLEATGSTFKHNSINVGSTHKHGGVTSGGGISGNPF